MKILGKELKFNNNNVYHTGYKPSKSDIGLGSVNNWGASSDKTHNSTTTYATTNMVAQVRAEKANISHGNHVPTTQTANARTFLRNDNTWQSLPAASTSATGIVQLSSAINSTSTTLAATASAVKSAYDLANSKANASHTHSYLPLSGGTLTSSSFGPLVIKRSGSTNAASITFSNDNGTLGSIGMTASANGGLVRWSNDTNSSYTVLDTGNYKNTVTPANIGAATSSHTHTSLTGITLLKFATDSTDSASISTTIDGTNTYFDFNLSDDPSQNDMWRWRFTPSGGTVFNAMTLDATSTTAAKLTVQGTIAATTFTGTLSGNATTATTLQAARTINGTSFNGSANITTANWGTARTITIGNTGKSVNGSGNVSWSLSEIGAASSSHNHDNMYYTESEMNTKLNTKVNTSDYTLTTITKTLTIGTSWMDTGIQSTNLNTGSYMIQVSGMDSTATSFWSEMWTGVMSWYSSNTNSTDADEILLHKAGHASNGRTIYLRTLRTSNGVLKLQICASTSLSSTSITFKFRKLI